MTKFKVKSPLEATKTKLFGTQITLCDVSSYPSSANFSRT